MVTVYAEFEGHVSKNLLGKIKGVRKVEKVQDGWLIEGPKTANLRKDVAQFAQENKLLVLTLRVEEKRLEEVFKSLTKA
jgi:ABC-2 type transport system ATP-binding protein